MKEEPETKCSEHGFQHSWVDATSNMVYPTHPPQYPDKEERCINCDLVRTYRSKEEKWFDYSHWNKEIIR